MTKVLLAGLLLSLISSPLFAQDPAEVYEPKTFKSCDQSLLYRYLEPKNLSPVDCKQYPLVVFLHGAGERGDDNTKQLVHGMKDFITPENREKYPCFLIAPQCPEEEKWVNVPWDGETHKTPEKPADSLALVFKLIDSLVETKLIDRQRIYITGLSMGGYGTWDALVRKPDLFAAAVPICGGGDESEAAKLVGIPIWAFHGDEDAAVKPFRSTNMIEAIEKAGGEPKLTIYPGVGHDSWSQTYADPQVLEWLFDQRKDGKSGIPFSRTVPK